MTRFRIWCAAACMLLWGSAAYPQAGPAVMVAARQSERVVAPAPGHAAGAVRADSVIDLVYMGGTDCPPCRNWKLFDLPKLRGTQEFQHIRFTEVKKWIPDPVPDAKDLPEHLRPLHDELVRVIKRTKGSPFFALLVDGVGIEGGWGTGTYEALLPLMGDLVARKLAALGK